EESVSKTTDGHRRRKKQRFPRHKNFGRPNIGHDLFRRRLHRAAVEPRQRQRSTHESQELATVDGICPGCGLAWKLVLQELLKLVRLRQFLQAAPVGFALGSGQTPAEGSKIQKVILRVVHRWHVEQLVKLAELRMPYRFTRSCPRFSWSG